MATTTARAPRTREIEGRDSVGLYLDEIARNLRLVVTKVEDLERAAREENSRRRQAREWAQRMASRNGFEKWWDGLWGSEQPPVSNLKDSGPAASVSAPTSRPRQTRRHTANRRKTSGERPAPASRPPERKTPPAVARRLPLAQ